jgi:hypothetical protein
VPVQHIPAIVHLSGGEIDELDMIYGRPGAK